MRTENAGKADIWGHVVFALLALLAARFWQERTLILDAAFQGYLFISNGHPAIMVERFGAALVQLLPLAGVWAGAPLHTVLVLYSVSVVCFHWALFSICLHGLRDRKAALAILLFNILLTGDSFYWMQNELLQAISLMFVSWSWWMRQPINWRHAMPGILLATTVAYLHPLVFFPLVFSWLFFWLKTPHSLSFRQWRHAHGFPAKKMLLAIAGLYALIFCSKYVFRQPNFYDRGMTGQYVREFRFSWKNLLHSESLRDFTAHLDDNFLFFLPVLALVTGYYLARRRWPAAVLVVAFVALYCLLIMQRFLHDDRWYIQESHYQALAVFLILPLVWDILPGVVAQISKPVLIIFTVLWLVIRITGIWNTHRAYTQRVAYIRDLAAKAKNFEGRKQVAGYDQLDRKTLLMYWGLPFETLQISALEGPDSVRVVAVAENPDSLAALLPHDSMPSFLMIPRKAFRDWPSAYYRMPADASPYRIWPR